MRKLILALLLLALSVPASAEDRIAWGGSMMVVGGGTPAAGLNAVDMSRGFEADSDPSGWAETDTTSSLNRYSTDQAHSGTHSMSVVVAQDNVKAFQYYDMGAAKTSLSEAVWFYASTTSGNVAIESVGIASSSACNSFGVRIYYDRAGASVYGFTIRGTTTSAKINVTTGAWYRLEVSYTQNSTSSLRIFDAVGSELSGSPVSITANDTASRYLCYGVLGIHAAGITYTLYYDDIGVDWTDSTTPLWRYTVAD